MKQKTIIEINSDLPLDKMGNHVLLWDSTKKCYYAMTLDKLLSTQKEKINKLEKDMVALQKNAQAIIDLMQHDIETFKENMLRERQEFLANYKDTNGKIIEMVKSFVDKEGD